MGKARFGKLSCLWTGLYFSMYPLSEIVFFNPIALRKAKIVYNFVLSVCKRVKIELVSMLLFQNSKLGVNCIREGKIMGLLDI